MMEVASDRRNHDPWAATFAEGSVSYGGMSITVSDVGPGMIHSWAYETFPGVAIAAGACRNARPSRCENE